MSDAPWMSDRPLHEMLDELQYLGRRRKLRLFAVAAWRRMERMLRKWEPERRADDERICQRNPLIGETQIRDCDAIMAQLDDPPVRQAVEVAEAYADGGATYDQLLQAYVDLSQSRWPTPTDAAEAAGEVANPGQGEGNDRHGAGWAATTIARTLTDFVTPGMRGGTIWNDVYERQEDELRWLLRHLAGPRPEAPTEPRTWPAVVVELAQALYDGTDNRLILADALEESGSADLAQHFRAEEWHPKGCWVVDWILGKS